MNDLSLLLNSSNGQRMDVISLNLMRDVVENFNFSRSRYRGAEPDTRRDLDANCGYPRTEELNVDDHYRFMFDRESIAERVVSYHPKQTWKVNPTVYEDEDSETETEFETAVGELAKTLRGPSWFQDEEGNPVWEHMLRADILSGIGHFGIMLLGFDDLDENDGLEMAKPLKGFEEETPDKPQKSASKLLYMREFDESLVQINQFNSDKGSPRYGQPEIYQVTLTDPTDNHAGTGLNLGTAHVHWSRVIHIADNLTSSSEVFAVPRQRPVFNRLLDLRKLYGGSAEMYWLAAFMGLSLETNPNLGGDVSVDWASVRQAMQDYMNRTQRFFAIPGMSAKPLSPQVADPSSQIDTQITAICVQLGVPKRKFMGSERGELSSGQDEDDDNGKIAGRQKNYATPRIIVPFFDRLILAGVLPTPKGYSVTWPDLNELSPKDAAAVLLQRTQAMQAYVAGGLDSMMEPLDYYTREMGFDDEEAEAIADAAVSHLEKATPNPDPNAEIVPGRQPPESLDAQVEKTTALAKAGAAGMPPGTKGAGKTKSPFVKNSAKAKASMEANDCGTGKGGFKAGNTCAKGGGGMSQKEWESSLGSDQVSAIHSWSIDHRSIRSCQKGEGDCSPEAKKSVQMLEAVYKTSPKYSGVVYRGLELAGGEEQSALFLAKLKKGLSHPAFTSTTKDANVAAEFANVGVVGSTTKFSPNKFVMTMYVRSGMDISNVVYEETTEEAEVLMPKGTKYKFKSIKKTATHYAVEMEEV